MTNEQAIEMLSEIRSGYNCFDESERRFYEALSKAIEALRDDDCQEGILTPEERSEVLNAIDALKICDSNYDGINCHKCPLRDTRWDGAWYDEETTCYTKLMRDSAKLLELPSAQPEIIRCENCRRRDDKWEDWEEGKVYWCDIMDGCVKADDYCSYAERRTDETN